MFSEDFFKLSNRERESLTELSFKGKLLYNIFESYKEQQESHELKMDMFCKCLYECKNLIKINFSGNSLGTLKPESFIKLFMVLGCMNFQETDLGKNELNLLNSSTIQALNYFFSKNQGLQKINLNGNNLGRLAPNQFKLFFLALQKNSRLRHINLAGNEIFDIYPKYHKLCYKELVSCLTTQSIDLSKCISNKAPEHIDENKLTEFLKIKVEFINFFKTHLTPNNNPNQINGPNLFESFCEVLAKNISSFSKKTAGKQIFKTRQFKSDEDSEKFIKEFSWQISYDSRLLSLLYSKQVCLRALEWLEWDGVCETLSGFHKLEFIDLSNNKKSPAFEFFNNFSFSCSNNPEVLNNFTFVFHITLLFKHLSKCERLEKVSFEENHLFEYPPEVLEEFCYSFSALPQSKQLNLGKLTCLPSPQFETLYNLLSTSRYTLNISQLNTAKDDQRVVLLSSLLQKRQEAFLALAAGLSQVPNLVKQNKYKILAYAFEGYLNPEKIPSADSMVINILNKKKLN